MKGANPCSLRLRYFSGAEGRNRTVDTGIFSPLLYRLSYLGTSPDKNFNLIPGKDLNYTSITRLSTSLFAGKRR